MQRERCRETKRFSFQVDGNLAASAPAATAGADAIGRDDRSIAAIVPEVIEIALGPFIFGADRTEREAAYRLDEAAYGHSITRQNEWYDADFRVRSA